MAVYSKQLGNKLHHETLCPFSPPPKHPVGAGPACDNCSDSAVAGMACSYRAPLKMPSSSRRQGTRYLISMDSRLRGNDKWGKQAIRVADARKI